VLTNLRIENFVHIDKLELEFQDGFVAITGETGAGKSVLVNAISFLCGRQADEDFIKKDAQDAIIEGVFEVESSEFLGEGEKQLIIYRKISRGKSGIARINNQTVTLKKLKEITTPLINICSQHEQQLLFDRAYQLELLDLFGQGDLALVLEQYKSVYSLWKEKNSFLDRFNKDQSEVLRKKEFLEFQVQDIEKCNFKIGEEERLEKQKKELNNADKIKAGLNTLCDNFDKIKRFLADSEHEIQALQTTGDDYLELAGFLQKTEIELNEYLLEMQKKSRDFAEIEELDIETVEARLDLIFRFKNKYKVNSLAALLELQEKFNKELFELNKLTNNSQAAEKELAVLRKKIDKNLQFMHKKRTENAVVLARMINEQLEDLGFKKARFEIRVLFDEDNISLTGADDVDFLISTIEGSPLKPVQKIASGGELSRIMLAIRMIFAQKRSVGVLFFDEIDMGIGGLTANKIGEKLKVISETGQTFCITHLAQVAKYADYHYVVEKEELENQKTVLKIYLLKADEKVAELHRMIGGQEITRLFAFEKSK
jgi:DNA repair protein RecN (Recombination protein N)